MVIVRDPWWREPVPSNSTGESMTQQSAHDQTDINRIVKRYGESGVWSHLAPVQPTYGDFTGARDLSEAYELVRQVEEEFELLPAAVREAADYDAAVYLEMLAAPEGAAALQAAGLPLAEAPGDGAASPEPPPHPGGETPPEPAPDLGARSAPEPPQ